MAATALTPECLALIDRFAALSEQWKAETALLSSSTAMIAHPAYRAITDLGPATLPLLLRDLEREPAHWFEALKAISSEDPVPREHWGDIQAMRADWLNSVAGGIYGEVVVVLGRRRTG